MRGVNSRENAILQFCLNATPGKFPAPGEFSSDDTGRVSMENNLSSSSLLPIQVIRVELSSFALRRLNHSGRVRDWFDLAMLLDTIGVD
jgi:hypothetical protein